jgi:hypothetical protein
VQVLAAHVHKWQAETWYTQCSRIRWSAIERTSSTAASCCVVEAAAAVQCPCVTAVTPLDVTDDAPAANTFTAVALLLLLLPTLDSWYSCRADSMSLEFIAFAALRMCVRITNIISKHRDCDEL